MGRTRIKMCGTTRVQDAVTAAELGVDAVGLIFVEKSPRCVSREQALAICRELPPFVQKIGVFMDASRESIEETVLFTGLNGVQLHGKESALFCKELRTLLPCCTLLKAIRVGAATHPDDFSSYEESVSGFVLDTYIKGIAGGTGLVFDWSLLQGLHIGKPFLLAGGLNPENIMDSLQIVAPYGIDINSGVESAPGQKDHRKLTTLIDSVRRYDGERTDCLL